MTGTYQHKRLKRYIQPSFQLVPGVRSLSLHSSGNEQNRVSSRTKFPNCQVIVICCDKATHLDPLHSGNLSSIPLVYADWLIDNAVEASRCAILTVRSAANSI